MSEYHILRDKDYDPLLPVELNEIVWVTDYGKDNDFIRIPLRVIKTYDDGTWDGELIEGEA